MLNFKYALIVFMLSGCKNIYTSGNFVSKANIEKLQSQRPSKNEVIEIIGAASIKENENSWLYVGRTMSKRPYGMPQVTHQEILKIEFGVNGLMKNLEVIEDGHNNISINTHETPRIYKDKNAFQDFYHHIGKYNVKQKIR